MTEILSENRMFPCLFKIKSSWTTGNSNSPLSWNEINTSGESRISKRGTPTPKVWRQPIIGPTFPENCKKIKKFWPKEGRAPGAPEIRQWMQNNRVVSWYIKVCEKPVADSQQNVHTVQANLRLTNYRKIFTSESSAISSLYETSERSGNNATFLCRWHAYK